MLLRDKRQAFRLQVPSLRSEKEVAIAQVQIGKILLTSPQLFATFRAACGGPKVVSKSSADDF